jgi:hypothetical protein
MRTADPIGSAKAVEAAIQRTSEASVAAMNEFVFIAPLIRY